MKKRDKKEESIASKVSKIVISLTLAVIAYYFICITNDDVILSAGVGAASFLLFYFSWRRGFFDFILALLASVFIFTSLEISFELGLMLNFIISLLSALILLYIYNKKKSDNTFAWLLLALFVAVWVIVAFNVRYREGWELENYLTVPFVLILIGISKWFKFSKTSYVLLFTFMTMHAIGGHYTYAEVPFGDWMKEFFGFDRNMYDRMVHFSFGLLLAYPVREIFVRVGSSRGIWALWGPVELVFGLSAIYEVIEWGAAVVFGGDLGIAFLGAQGDIWDAQKDMALAGLGSIITMIVTAIVRFAYFGKSYWLEIKDSFRSKRGILGERALNR